MLYLNDFTVISVLTVLSNLTLTNVVFELLILIFTLHSNGYLTLTNVVFESATASRQYLQILSFNFNKCCI